MRPIPASVCGSDWYLAHAGRWERSDILNRSVLVRGLLCLSLLLLAACGRDPVAPPPLFCVMGKVAVPGVDQFGRPVTDTVLAPICVREGAVKP